MLSFTYYHKLLCYDKMCICQFFTQYCQDPVKFKGKKKRNYQGFVDDGMKLINEKDIVVVASSNDMSISSLQGGGGIVGVMSDTRVKRTGAMKNHLITIAP